MKKVVIGVLAFCSGILTSHAILIQSIHISSTYVCANLIRGMLCNDRVQWLETSVLIDLRTKQKCFSFFALEYEHNFFCDHRD